MTLIHTALLCEAQTFIEKYKLLKINSKPKIYSNEKLIVTVGGVGKEHTISSLKYIFKNYSIKKAYNIGVAGCNNTLVNIGELYCTNHKLDGMKHLPLVTNDFVTIQPKLNETSLFDMEGKYFLNICKNYLKSEDIFILKVVSDHLAVKSLQKEFVKKLIFQNYLILHTTIS